MAFTLNNSLQGADSSRTVKIPFGRTFRPSCSFKILGKRKHVFLSIEIGAVSSRLDQTHKADSNPQSLEVFYENTVSVHNLPTRSIRLERCAIAEHYHLAACIRSADYRYSASGRASGREADRISSISSPTLDRTGTYCEQANAEVFCGFGADEIR
jgi:hypothetical protein